MLLLLLVASPESMGMGSSDGAAAAHPLQDKAAYVVAVVDSERTAGQIRRGRGW